MKLNAEPGYYAFVVFSEVKLDPGFMEINILMEIESLLNNAEYAGNC